jgi:phage terminase large subunit GpA-like protein
MGDTANEVDWLKLDELLNREWPTPAGTSMSVRILAVDSGFNTQMVYNWARRHPMSRVIATKGVTKAKSAVGIASPVDVTVRGKRIARGYKVWPVGVDILKSELYGWLRLPVPEPGQPYPGGFCHFPEYDKEFFRQLTAEQLVSIADKRTGFTVHEWQLIPGRQNHFLDARVYARAAAYVIGLDRMVTPTTQPAAVQLPAPVSQPKATQESRPRGGFYSADSRFLGPRAKKGWLR